MQLSKQNLNTAGMVTLSLTGQPVTLVTPLNILLIGLSEGDKEYISETIQILQKLDPNCKGLFEEFRNDQFEGFVFHTLFLLDGKPDLVELVIEMLTGSGVVVSLPSDLVSLIVVDNKDFILRYVQGLSNNFGIKFRFIPEYCKHNELCQLTFQCNLTAEAVSTLSFPFSISIRGNHFQLEDILAAFPKQTI